ncbi:serine hydrolase [Cognatiyoonia sp. IB215182]|uniref:serine hydrolase domain-containing protein n=1 Tax=Cognatiyoonia sp. IB215182 TaxID=3097353 RepID=UPI002A24F2CD|nr:serine hydrolase [Cognatiyoonia sp. IB215182]
MALSLVAAGGYLWLRNSPYWAGITLFAEDMRVENFRSMDRIMPARDIPSGDDIWTFGTYDRGLPDTYEFEGGERSVSAFLNETMTTGLLVLQDGIITHEEYRLGASETSPFTSFSVAKSVVSTLVGIAIAEGHIASVDDQITDYVPALAGSGYDGVTIEDVLTMSSGVAFDEDYDNPMSDVNRLIYGVMAGRSLANALADLERAREPGTYNEYISSDTIALGLVLETATGMPNEAYLATRLWQPMGAEGPAFWNTGRAGEVLPYCCLNARLRDYARFGRLILEAGARDSVQIVPRDWVEISTRSSAPRLEPGDNPASFWTFGYGYHWWIPENPQDEVLAIGIWGQYIYIDRAHETVIVKTSADYDFDIRDHETVALFRAIASHTALGQD